MQFEELIKARGFNPKSFYKVVGLDRQLIYAYRRGISKPTMENIIRISRTLKVTTDELIKSFNE